MKKSRKLAAALSLNGIGAVGCFAEAGDTDVEAILQPVTNGATDYKAAAAVGLVDSTGRVRCSGALVAPRHVLTAAHCIVDGESPPSVSFSLGVGPPFERSYRTEIHPQFEVTGAFGSKYAHDLALIYLVEESVVEPLDVAIDPAEVGAMVRVIGYGRTTPESDDQGVRRSGSTSTISMDEGTLVIRGAPTQPCAFDSGGPVISGDGMLIGVISSGDRACRTGARIARADVDREWIQYAIARSGQAPVHLSTDSSASATSCAPIPDRLGESSTLFLQCAPGVFCARCARRRMMSNGGTKRSRNSSRTLR